MKIINIVIITTFSLFLSSCNSEQKYPVNKRYWEVDDYHNVITELRFGLEPDEKLPTFNDPETSIIVEKLTDHQNFKIVLNDQELGLIHRKKVASDFFDQWKDMQDIYPARDRKDNYIYDIEMLKVYHFGLDLQLLYFQLGNKEIMESAPDPHSVRLNSIINSNVRILVGNFNNYIDEINNEKSFSEKGKELLAEGLDEYFPKLINLYPDFNYTEMLKKIDLMYNKSESTRIKNSLNNLKEFINSKKQPKEIQKTSKK